MIDTDARIKIRQAVDDFLSDRIGSCEFDARLFEVAARARDATVHEAANLLWHIYSDNHNHLVNLNREGWNLVQRLLLVLDSRAELNRSRRWIWDTSQLLAAVTLVALLPLALISLVIPLVKGGLISMRISSVRCRIQAAAERPDPLRIWPFPSLNALQRALARSTSFRKQPFRTELTRRGSSVWFNNLSLPYCIEWPLSRAGWCLISPLCLLWACMPISVSSVELVEPD